MKPVTYLESEADLPHCPREMELLLSPRELARTGRLSLAECHRLARLIGARGGRAVLEWDILMNGPVLRQLERDVLPQIDWAAFDAIRVQDPGALDYVLNQRVDIQLNLSGGNHNLRAIQTWAGLAGPRLKRVILSSELSKSALLDMLAQLSVPAEILGLGPILLLYTPRHLLTPLGVSGGLAHADSLEGKHRRLPVRENEHGTFLFNSKDLCLLAAADELQAANLAALRLDLRFAGGPGLLGRVLPCLGMPDALERVQDFWPVKLIPGFFRANKSDVFFKHLKNRRIDKSGEHYMGEVVDVKKGSHLGILLQNPHRNLRPHCRVRLLTPEGKDKTIALGKLKNSLMEEVALAREGEVVFIPHTGGVPVGTGVYLNDPPRHDLGS